MTMVRMIMSTVTMTLVRMVMTLYILCPYHDGNYDIGITGGGAVIFQMTTAMTHPANGNNDTNTC